MQRTVYLNGEYLPEGEAKISIFDRAVLFGDAIYEVVGVLDGKLIDFDAHMQRYHSSVDKLKIPKPLSDEQLLTAFRDLVDINKVHEGLVYMQITRGQAERDFVWQDDLQPTVFMFTQHKSPFENEFAKTGLILKSVEDIRWPRRDIKSVNLLGQVLAKQAASDAGADEALMIDNDGFVTEGGCSSFFIVKRDLLLTRPLSQDILPGVTRKALIALCTTHGIRLVESKFNLAEALAADEAFISGASSYLLPVVEIDEQKIGNGRPGALYQKLSKIYVDYARANAI